MRSWLFHPLIFYPLVLILAAAVIGLSLMPQMLPRPPAPVAGLIEGDALTLQGAAFDAPDDPPQQHVTVVRDLFGKPQSLRIAVLPEQAENPDPSETGVRIQLDPQSAAMLSDRRLTVVVTYRPLPVNAASALALSLQGAQPTGWVVRPIPPLSGTVEFNLPRTPGVTGIGLRAISGNPGPEAYGVEIVSIHASPRVRN